MGNRIQKKRPILLTVLVILLVSLSAYLLGWSSLLTVKSFEVQGSMAQTEILNKLSNVVNISYGIILSSLIFFLNLLYFSFSVIISTIGYSSSSTICSTDSYSESVNLSLSIPNSIFVDS